MFLADQYFCRSPVNLAAMYVVDRYFTPAMRMYDQWRALRRANELKSSTQLSASGSQKGTSGTPGS